MLTRSSLNIGDSLNSDVSKRALNERMFTEIAPRYDFITRVLSFGQDRAWKKTLVQLLPIAPARDCLDLACGTGDLTFMLAKKYPLGNVTGLDITEDMLILSRTRNLFPNVQFVQGDMGDTKLADASLDIVTGGYALRNAPDLLVTLKEIHRILKPGGIAAFLDFSKPANARAQRIEYRILKYWTGMWGLILHRNHQVYSYIAESLAQYPDREALARMFTECGFAISTSKLNFFGITEILIVQKL